ncbi:hypothetical protein [Thalassomonas haliotis]|uniref:Uncharacterized protein n=1 Tax=Thalassomonas haliotis TaxID=485448 RepID=A0ABY7VDW0_9GAMM|nr:hypothetical protein [Thalassomonas haliotis]WDE11587.1 hypothetical protein H3N35_25860 [Thalassomonas haliotis]
MRLITFIKITFIFITSLISGRVLAHTDHVLGEGMLHYLYHGLFVVIVLLVLANILGWWRAKAKNNR